MGYARLGHVLLGAAPPLAIFASLITGVQSRAPVAISFALIALALCCRLTPSARPLSCSLPLPAAVFGFLPLLQAIPWPESVWLRLTTIDATLQAELAQLGIRPPTSWSLQPEASVRAGVAAIAATAAFLLARHAAARRAASWSLTVLLLAVTAWQSFEGLKQYSAGLWLLDGGEVAHGSFANRGYYAAFLNAGLWFAAGSAYSQALRGDASPVRAALAIGSIFTALLSLSAIIASQSRSALLAVCVLTLAAISLLPLGGYKRAAVALSAIICGGVFLSTPVAGPLLERFRQLYEQGGDPGRLLIWRDSLAVVTPFGSGAGTFPWAFERTTPYFLRKSVDTAHGDYVEWAVEFGPWFGALFALSLATALACLLRRAQRASDPEPGALAFGAVFGAGALALHALTDSVLQSPALLLLLACLLGLASGLTAAIPSRRQPLGAGLLAAGLCAATMLLGGALERLAFIPLFQTTRQAQLEGNFFEARRGYAAALRANPRAAPVWLALAEMARVEGDTGQALEFVRVAQGVEPFTYRVEWALADLELSNGHLGEGIETLRMICQELPDLRPAAYLLAYRAGASLEMIEGRLTAPEPYAVGEYLAFLIRSGNHDQVPAARRRLVEGQGVALSDAHQRYIADYAE